MARARSHLFRVTLLWFRICHGPGVVAAEVKISPHLTSLPSFPLQPPTSSTFRLQPPKSRHRLYRNYLHSICSLLY